MHRSAPPKRTVRITRKFRAHQHWNASVWVYLQACNLKSQQRWAPLPKLHQTHKHPPPSLHIHLITTTRKGWEEMRAIIPALREVRWPQRVLDRSRWCGPSLQWIRIQSDSGLERRRLLNWRWWLPQMELRVTVHQWCMEWPGCSRPPQWVTPLFQWRPWVLHEKYAYWLLIACGVVVSYKILPKYFI